MPDSKLSNERRINALSRTRSRALLFRLTIILLLAVTFTLPFAKDSHAQEIADWLNTSNDRSSAIFQQGTNWSTGLSPSADQIVRFSEAEDYGVFWDTTTGDQTVQQLQVRNGNVMFENLSSEQATLTLSDGLTLAGADTSLEVKGIHLLLDGPLQYENGRNASLTLGEGSRLTQGIGAGSFRLSGSLKLEAGAVAETGATILDPEFSIVPNEAAASVEVRGEGTRLENSNSLTIGLFGPASLSVLEGGFTGATFGYIGTASESDGSVTVSGDGSLFQLSELLEVGARGNGHLNIRDGGRVIASNSDIASRSNSNENDLSTLTISGIDSTLEITETLLVAKAGTGTLSVSNSGQVITNTLGIAENVGSVGRADVVGHQSRLTGTGFAGIGFGGEGTLNVAAGATVESDFAVIGFNADADGTVNVSGENSSWTVSNGLSVGELGHGELRIENGGRVSTDFSSIGVADGSSGNVTVSGTNAQWNNTQSIVIGQSGEGTLRIEAGGHVSADVSAIGVESTSSGSAVVTGNLSHWQTASSLVVGNEGNGELLVDSGGMVSSDFGLLGVQPGSSGVVTVTGDGSRWNLSNDLEVAQRNSGVLTISDGGAVESLSTRIGLVTNATGRVDVVGQGSILTAPEALDIGYSANGNLLIAEGASSITGLSSIGKMGAGVGAVEVTGEGSVWQIDNDLLIGRNGIGQLTVRDGGMVHSEDSYLGVSRLSRGNVTVLDTGSLWQVDGDLTVGSEGMAQLDVQSGGSIVSTNGVVGTNGDLDNVTAQGTVSVKGKGSSWNNHFLLYVGQTGIGSLNVFDGGSVTSEITIVGASENGHGTVEVSGNDSELVSLRALSIGRFIPVEGAGSGSLSIDQSATVRVGDDITTRSGLIVSNSGFTATDPRESLLGFENVDLRIENGSSMTVTDSNIYLGLNASHSGQATVRGNDSRLAIIGAGTTYVGFDGVGTLEIEAGATVSGQRGMVGFNQTAEASVNVTGSQSQWLNSGNLIVANRGTGNLMVQDSGSVSSVGATIGRESEATGTVTITGVGSAWSNEGLLLVGSQGDAIVNVLAGGTLSTHRSTIARDVGSAGLVNVSGTGSIWNNSGMAVIGSLGEANLNLESGGSLVTEGPLVIGDLGEINLSESASLTADAGLTSSGLIRSTMGNANINGDTTLVGGRVEVSVGSHLTFQGDLILEDASSNLATEGTVSVLGSFNGGSDGAGTVKLAGDFPPSAELTDFGGNLDLMNSSNAVIKIAGTQPSEFTAIRVQQDLTVAGTLTIQLDDRLEVKLADEWLIFNVLGSQTGIFTDLNENDIVAHLDGFDLRLNYASGDGNDIGLYAVSNGDFDHDGDVDSADIDFYSGNIGRSIFEGPFVQTVDPELQPLDLNGDQMVDQLDLGLHVAQLVETSGGQAGTFIGDINLDGSVDVLGDAFVLVSNLGAAGGWSNGDLNQDGQIDVLGDAFALVSNLGQSRPASLNASSSAIPEPGSFSLFVAIGCAMGTRRRKA
jgi:T5SS/PEP-CTERM-associated repeat protein